MKTEEINKRIEWINARTPLNDLQKEYVSLIVSESIKDKTKELQEQLAEVTRMRNHLEECVNMRIEQLAAKEKEWISVEDKLPNINDCIWQLRDLGERKLVNECIWDNSELKCYKMNNMTHWMICNKPNYLTPQIKR